jgi:hypothetical protein
VCDRVRAFRRVKAARTIDGAVPSRLRSVLGERRNQPFGLRPLRQQRRNPNKERKRFDAFALSVQKHFIRVYRFSIFCIICCVS